MKYSSYIKIIIVSFLITSCTYAGQSSDVKKQANNELLKFAKANCFFWYFKKKNYDLKDIRAISGGIVETGSYSAEKYQKIAFLVKEYKPAISTKQNIDIDLYKCFLIDSDQLFLNSIESLN